MRGLCECQQITEGHEVRHSTQHAARRWIGESNQDLAAPGCAMATVVVAETRKGCREHSVGIYANKSAPRFSRPCRTTPLGVVQTQCLLPDGWTLSNCNNSLKLLRELINSNTCTERSRLEVSSLLRAYAKIASHEVVDVCHITRETYVVIMFCLTKHSAMNSTSNSFVHLYLNCKEWLAL